MRVAELERRMWSGAFAAFLGAGIGLVASALRTAWQAGQVHAYTRATLVEVLLLCGAALAAWWIAAACRQLALRPLPPTRPETPRRQPHVHLVGPGQGFP